MNPWTEKHRPKKFLEICGQDDAICKTENFIKNFKNSRKKALILHGPPGTGKTTLAHVAAGETNSEIFELNASDLRNKNKLQEILKPAIEQQSLGSSGKIILVDEVDGISAVDRGGLQELLDLIKTTPYPLILTANDIWDRKFSQLRKASEIVQVKEVDYNTIKDVMIKILKKENLFINNNLLTSISVRAKGDLRAAINDLQSLARMRDPSLITLDERNKETNIFSALKFVLKGKPTKETINIYDSLKMGLDEIMLWVEENIPSEYSGEELANAVDKLSKADIFRGRIYKQQYWRFLVYENFFLSYGISAAKKETKTKNTFYKKPSRILKIWINNNRIAKKKSIAEKYAKYCHIGSKRALKEFPYIKQILKNPITRKELKLNEDEIIYLDKPITSG
jgi:replication factor C large subunit